MQEAAAIPQAIASKMSYRVSFSGSIRWLSLSFLRFFMLRGISSYIILNLVWHHVEVSSAHITLILYWTYRCVVSLSFRVLNCSMVHYP